MSSPKHVSAHKFVRPELAFGVFTYIYQCFNTHLQNKGLSWDCHLLDKNSTFPHTLAQVLQDGDLLFTDTLIPPMCPLCSLHGSKSESWDTLRILPEGGGWNPFPCCRFTIVVSCAFPSCFPEWSYGLSIIPLHKPGTLPRISAAKGGEHSFLPQERELPVQMFNVYSSLQICAN